jgi:hypothetical protein
MTEAQLDLARRAVACKGFRWMPGMRWETDDDHGRLDDFQPEYMGRPADALPDLTDPATLGCLLALVRDAWGAPRALVRLSSNGKSFHLFDVDRVTITKGNWAAFLCGDWGVQSEAEALVAALEAAPDIERGEHRREEEP